MPVFEYENARDTATIDYLVECALGLYDAGAHLLQAREDKSPHGGRSWKEHPLTRAEVEACVSQGMKIGIKSPGYDIGISCLDSDRGVHMIDEAANILGRQPLVVHESSRKSPDKCHAWYCTPNPVTARFWAGGEIFSAHTSYVVLHNIPAVWAAYRIASANWRELAVDLSPIVTRKQQPTTLDSLNPVEGMVAIGDYGEVPEENRHDTAVRKIARAVETSETKGEMQDKLALVINAHKQAMKNETDRIRKAGVKTEIQNFRVFAEGSWAKKRARKNYEAEIVGLLQTNTPPERFEPMIASLAERFRDECVKNNWPTPETCEGDLQACLEYNQTKMAARRLFTETAAKARKEQTTALNQEAAKTFEASGDGMFEVDSPWGTIASWQEAATAIGVKFKYNSFIGRGQVWLPRQILPRDDRGRARPEGGQWMDLTDELMSVVVGSIERHAFAVVPGSGKEVVKRGVYLGRNKSREAREEMFARNTYCPMQDYFDALPEWDAIPRIHESMERGGMKIDAGPFTEAVQRFVWLFVVRNTLLPGSSMREYIVLHGEHDSGKSKFVELVLPYHLREYWNGAFSLAGTLKQKLERSIGKALMECSEMGTGGKKNWDEVKQWLTLSEVNGERMAYKEFIRRHKLTATTVFTTNSSELPPTDDAVISRFVWANVLTPATRRRDASGKEERIVWHHFDELVDPQQPEKGTFREQYFAEAKAFVKQHAHKVQWKDRGDMVGEWRSNIPWLPEGYKEELVKWNRQAGGVFTTDQSRLIEDIDAAIGLLASHFEIVPGDDNGFFPNMEIKTAINSIRDECKFESWWDVQTSPNTAAREQKIRDIKSVATDTQFANAIDQWAKNNRLIVTRSSRRWQGSGDSKVRGMVFTFKNKDLQQQHG